jgi:hypothetical protein
VKLGDPHHIEVSIDNVNAFAIIIMNRIDSLSHSLAANQMSQLDENQVSDVKDQGGQAFDVLHQVILSSLGCAMEMRNSKLCL